jgi:hypothetical protein
MPVFECCRCNDLTYSSARASALACAQCGSERRRVLDDVRSFDEARAMPRALAPGDHVCATFTDPRQIAPLAAQTLRAARGHGALPVAFAAPDVRGAIEHALGSGAATAEDVDWRDPADAYGGAFDPDGIVGHFVAMARDEQRPICVIGCPHEPIDAFTTRTEWERFERLITDAAVDSGLTVLCLYDARLHEPHALEHANGVHPLHEANGQVSRNEVYAWSSPSPSSA